MHHKALMSMEIDYCNVIDKITHTDQALSR